MIRVMRCSCCGGPVTKLRPPIEPSNRPEESFTVWQCLLCNAELRVGSGHLCSVRTVGACTVPAASGNRHGRRA